MPSVEEVRSTAHRALTAVGVPDAFADLQVSLLLEAELRGVASHGLLRLPRVVERIQNGATNPQTTGDGIWSGDSLLRVDGENGLGPVVAISALDKISARARVNGIAAVALKNCDHLGMLAWYAERVARSGQVLIALTISEALVHPWAGSQALLGTNPIAIGVPTEKEPFVFDMATSLVSMGKVHDYANRNEPLPHGWAVDAHGQPTTDASAAKHGAIAPFGGAKGYGLGLAFELLVVSLTGSAVGRDVRGTLDSTHPSNKGDLFIVLEPSNGTASVVSAFVEQLRTSAPMDANNPVRVPGDRASHERQRRLTAGLDLPKDVWARIVDLAENQHKTGGN